MPVFRTLLLFICRTLHTWGGNFCVHLWYMGTTPRIEPWMFFIIKQMGRSSKARFPLPLQVNFPCGIRVMSELFAFISVQQYFKFWVQEPASKFIATLCYCLPCHPRCNFTEQTWPKHFLSHFNTLKTFIVRTYSDSALLATGICRHWTCRLRQKPLEKFNFVCVEKRKQISQHSKNGRVRSLFPCLLLA